MQPQTRKACTIFGPTVSLCRRIALSLVIVRLMLVPVVLLGTHYLFEMGWIVDRIVLSVDVWVSLTEETEPISVA